MLVNEYLDQVIKSRAYKYSTSNWLPQLSRPLDQGQVSTLPNSDEIGICFKSKWMNQDMICLPPKHTEM
jgi:hypothetical protein